MTFAQAFKIGFAASLGYYVTKFLASMLIAAATVYLLGDVAAL